MKCLKCGYCCIHYDVAIVNDPDLGFIEGNFIHKPCGTPCKHLVGNEAGKYSCDVHNKEWYEETPCFSHGQTEKSDSENCRIGAYILSKKLNF